MTPSTQAAFLRLTQCTSADESALGKLKGGHKVRMPFSPSFDSNSKVQNSSTTSETSSPLPPHVSCARKPVLTRNNLSYQEPCHGWEADPLPPMKRMEALPYGFQLALLTSVVSNTQIPYFTKGVYNMACPLTVVWIGLRYIVPHGVSDIRPVDTRKRQA